MGEFLFVGGKIGNGGKLRKGKDDDYVKNQSSKDDKSGRHPSIVSAKWVNACIVFGFRFESRGVM